MALKTGIKWILWIVAGLLLLGAVLYFTRPIYLPDRFLKQQLEKRLSSASGVKINIEEGHFYLFRRLRLFRITVSDTTGRFNLSIGEITARYRLLPLIRRRLVVSDLEILRPELHLQNYQPPLSQRLSPDTKPVTAFASTVPEPRIKSPVFTLPLYLIIEHLRIENGGLQYQQTTAPNQLAVSLNGLNVRADDITVHSVEDLTIPVAFDLTDTLALSFRQAEASADITAPVEFSGAGQFTMSSSSFTIQMTLHPLLTLHTDIDSSTVYPLPRMTADISARLEQLRDVYMDSINATLGKDSYVHASGSWLRSSDHPKFNVNVGESKFRLDDWWDILTNVAPLFGWDDWIRRRVLSGQFRLSHAKFEGSALGVQTHLKATLEWDFDDLSYRDDAARITFSGLAAHGVFSGSALPLDSLAGRMKMKMDFGALQFPKIGNRSVEAAPLQIAIAGQTKPEWNDASFDIHWEGHCLDGTKLTGQIRLSTDVLNLSNPLKSRGLQLFGNGSVENLPLATWTSLQPTGQVSTSFTVKLDGDQKVSLQLDGRASRLRLQTGEKAIEISDFPFTVSVRNAVQPEAEFIHIEDIRVNLPPFFSTVTEGKITKDFRSIILDNELTLDIGTILPLMRPLLPDDWQNLEARGRYRGAAAVSFASPPSGAGWNYQVRLHSDDAFFQLPRFGVGLKTPALTVLFAGGAKAMRFSAEISGSDLSCSQLRKNPYREIACKLDVSYDDAHKTGKGSLAFAAGTLGLQMNLNGGFKRLSAGFAGDADLMLKLDAPSDVQLLEGLNMRGNGLSEWRFSMTPDSILKIRGKLDVKDAEIRYLNQFYANGLNVHLPIKQFFSLRSGRVIAAEDHPLHFLSDPVLYAAAEHLIPPDASSGGFSCRSLKIGDYVIDDLEGTIETEPGMVTVPRLRMKAYDGEIHAALSVQYSRFQADSIRYQSRVAGLGLNTALLPHARKREGEDSEISAFARFRGRGVNFEHSFDLNGSLDITHIGSRVADNMLRFWDPNQKDPAVQTYRRYIRRGWGVRMFSFEIKDDFVYASIAPAKPSLSRPDMWILSKFIGLGKSITFSRVPLKFFLDATSP